MSRRSEAGAAAEPVLDPGPVARLRRLGERAGQDVLAEVTAIFRARAPAHLAELAAALDAGDARRLEQLAHSLKGSSGNLGARRVSRLAERLEAAARDGRLAGAEGQLTALRGELAAALDALAATPSRG